MDYRNKRRSPRRDYSHLSPSRRHYRSRTRSRSPHPRPSPLERRPSRTSPKQRRSRSPQRGYQRKEVNSYRRSRSPERKSRVDSGRPEYWGPNDPKVLARAVLSPHRLVVVKKTGHDDENEPQKQDGLNDRNRSNHDANVPADRRLTNGSRGGYGMTFQMLYQYTGRPCSYQPANADDNNGFKRNVYFLKRERETTAANRTNYSRRNREDRYSSESGAYGEADFYRKDGGRSRGSDRSEDCDWTDRHHRKPCEKKNLRRSDDRSYDIGRSSSLRKRENLKEKKHYDKEDEKKTRNSRDKRQREHRYQNEDRKEEQKDDDKEKEISAETAETDSSGNALNGNLVPGMPMRPPFVAPYPRVIIPPFPIPPPFRPPHLLPRFIPPFIPRPFRIPHPRVFPPNRFYPPVPPMY